MDRGGECDRAIDVFITNLRRSTSDQELQSALQIIPGILSVKIDRRTGGGSKRYGQASFSNIEKALAGIKILETIEIGGKKIRAHLKSFSPGQLLTVAPQCDSIYIGNIPWDTDSEELMSLFHAYEPLGCNIIISSKSGRSRGFAVMVFPSEKSATEAVEARNGVKFKDRILVCRIDRGPPQKKGNGSRDKGNLLYVGNIPKEMPEVDLKHAIEEVVPIVSMTVSNRSGSGRELERWGLVECETKEIADTGLIALRKVSLQEGAPPLFVRKYRA